MNILFGKRWFQFKVFCHYLEESEQLEFTLWTKYKWSFQNNIKEWGNVIHLFMPPPLNGTNQTSFFRFEVFFWCFLLFASSINYLLKITATIPKKNLWNWPCVTWSYLFPYYPTLADKLIQRYVSYRKEHDIKPSKSLQHL